MKGLFKNYSLPENAEVVFLLVFGILLQMTDGSPFTIKERWMIVWDTELPVKYFSQFVQKIIKTVLSMIVVVRCATTYAYVVSAMLVIFSLLKNSAPKLMLLWLLVAGLKSILLTFLEALVGVYVCSAFGQIRKACVEFVISKALEITFAGYLWGSVLNIYQEMQRKAEDTKNPELREQLFLQKERGRQRARSLPDESVLYKTACLNNFEFKDVPQIILQMLRRGDEMSRDSLLDPGMMLASVSNMGSFDNLKTSQSLGELGFVDLRSAQVVGLEEDDDSTPKDKALKFLKLTWSDVRRTQRNKTGLESEIFRIDEDAWERMATSGAHINAPKRPRAEVYIREIQQAEPEDDARKPRKRSFDLKFSWSFFNLYAAKQVSLQETDDEQDEESVIFREDEDEEGREEAEEPTPLFMSNIREEVVVNRIRLDFVSKKMKGNAYAELYKQDCMSVIGPEVFDKAPKLQKVTSLTRVKNHAEPVTCINLPAFPETESSKNINFYNESEEKICHTLSSELELNEVEHERQNIGDIERKEELSGKETESTEEIVSALDKNLTEGPFYIESDKMATPCEEKSEKPKPQKKAKFSCDSDHSEINETRQGTSPAPSFVLSREQIDYYEGRKPCYKRRRIKIRRIGKQTTAATSPVGQNYLENSDTCCCHRSSSKEAFDQENPESRKKPEMWPTQSNTSASQRGVGGGGKSYLGAQNERMCFLIDLFQKPLLDVLVTYYDLKKKVDMPGNGKKYSWNREAGFDDSLFKRYGMKKYESQENRARMWKSKVLKAAEAHRRKNSPMNLSEIRANSFITRKLLEYYLQKHYTTKAEEEVFLSLQVTNECGWTNLNDGNSRGGALCSAEKIDLSKAESKMIFFENPMDTERKQKERDGPREEHSKNTHCSALVSRQQLDFISKAKLGDEDNLRLSNRKILKSDTDFEKLKSKVQDRIPEVQESFDMASAEGRPEEESVSSQESDEPISLYYSKAANLASPLLDVKRFIYPDHIHYSYKHVKKKGFDVDISGGFPLLVRESLTMSTLPNNSVSTHPEFAITRRPMDLSFATTNAFTEWQNNEQSDIDSIFSEAKQARTRSGVETRTCKKERKPSDSDLIRSKNAKNAKRSKKNNDKDGSHYLLKTECKAKVKSYQNRSDFKHLCSGKDYLLFEKLLKMHFQLNSKQCTEFRNPERERTPVQISSAQLHSNKGRINSTYNPAIFLQENKTRNEKKKMETQEERTKDMFARLEREALLQSKNLHKSVPPLRRI